MKEIINFILKVLVVVGSIVLFYVIVRYPQYAIIIFPMYILPVISSRMLNDLSLEALVLFLILLIGIFISLLIYNNEAKYSPVIDNFIVMMEVVWILGYFYLLQKSSEKVNRERALYFERKEGLQNDISNLKFSYEKVREEIYKNTIQIKSYNSIEKITDHLSSMPTLKEIKNFVEEVLPSFFLEKVKIKLILNNPENEFEETVITNVKLSGRHLYVCEGKDDSDIISYYNGLMSIICLTLEEGLEKKEVQNFLLITSSQILSEDFLRIITILAKYISLNISNIRLLEMTSELAITDSLTGLFVQKYFKEILQEEINRATHYNKKLSVAMIDIDNFKSINDTYGHNAGDDVLVRLADILKTRCRETDIVARYGGDEFMVIFPEAKEKDAVAIVEEIRKTVSNEIVVAKDVSKGTAKKIKFKVSCGVKEYKKGLKVEEFIELVDNALYKSKIGGKNRTST